MDWVLCGSYVLKLYGADLSPNDLDVVPDLAPDNLERLAGCIETLDTVAAYMENWEHPRNTPEACAAWTPRPATPENLDWLLVTPLGMLDIVIENAAPYDELMDGATKFASAGTSFWTCDPKCVLRALETRTRKKDKERSDVYAAMRARFGMPPECKRD